MYREPIKAVQTKYRDVEYRSRLEARWAAMFDMLSWQHEYEPIDADFYIPDFVLNFKKAKVIVEIKGASTIDELVRMCSKMELFSNDIDDLCIALGSEIRQDNDGILCGIFYTHVKIEPCKFSFCRDCAKYGFNGLCFFCGADVGPKLHKSNCDSLISRWKQAGNISRWKPKQIY